MSDESNTYLYGLDRIAQQNIVGRQYYLGNALGSVRQLVNPVGPVIQARSYEPFGKQLSTAGNPLTKYGYTGEWTDSANLVYLRARYYDPAMGRFLSKDSVRGVITLPGTLNPYTYAVNNPLRYTDPSGEFPFLLFIAGGLLGGAIYGYGSQVINNFTQGMCLTEALYTNIDWLRVVLFAGSGGIVGLGIGTIGAGTQSLIYLLRTIASSGPVLYKAVEVSVSKIDYLLKDPGKTGGFSRLGYNKESLRALLISIGNSVNTTDLSKFTQYGTKFEKAIEVVGPSGKVGRITTVWQIDEGSNILRLITAWAEVFK